ncbi:hypothetical protein BH24ACT3_BH24ACT3_06510 [soil metagenome]
MRRSLVALLVALATVAGPGPLAGRAAAEVPIVVLEGNGFGHGVGLAQHGARWMAEAGRSTDQILAHFYPGTALGQATGVVRVAVLSADDRRAVLEFPQGGEVRSPRSGPQAPGFPVRIASGGQVSVRFDGGYRVEPLVTGQAATRDGQLLPPLLPTPTTQPRRDGGGGGGGDGGGGNEGGAPAPDGAPTTTTQPPSPAPQPPPPAQPAPPAGEPAPPSPGSPGSPTPPPTPVSAAPVWAVPDGGGTVAVPGRGRQYRGVVEATAAAGPLRLVNEVDVETYLKGMAEVPGSWPGAALGAQAVAARTYALRAMAAGGEICDDQRCQVYVGITGENAGMNGAVEATRNQVVTHGGALAAAVYSADAGGFTATTLEGFGTPDGVYPYLQAVRYDTPDPLPWRVEVSTADLARRVGYPGTLTGVRLTGTGPSGRALEVTLDGDQGSRAVPGLRFARALGLRSTLFTVTLGAADTAPPPPAAVSPLQAFPDDADAMAEDNLSGPSVARQVA